MDALLFLYFCSNKLFVSLRWGVANNNINNHRAMNAYSHYIKN